ncbi:hypothetical protein TRIUR3_08101 [Triticum urartu]|uniref:Uncharacterized protein n=1 Tax=Triticum urartu TaxID=4572 RepID=M7YZJ8_TRIUA|nr:hypothetical protein TRIUR3_08101 [Triticum urartu]
MACIFGNIEPENRQLFKGSCSNIKPYCLHTIKEFVRNNPFIYKGSPNRLLGIRRGLETMAYK